MLYKIVTVDSDPNFEFPIMVPDGRSETLESAMSYGTAWAETFPTDIVMLVEVVDG